MLVPRSSSLVVLLALVLGACGASTSASDAGHSADGSIASQTPPTGEAALTPWLAAGSYHDWHCESANHAGRAPSPHGTVRICVNDAVYAASGTGDLPVGAAAVKDIFDTSGATVGHAVMLRTSTATGGPGWYFYEQIPPDTMLPMGITISPTGVVADGNGASGQAMTVCAGCHAGAATTGRDLIFTPHPM